HEAGRGALFAGTAEPPIGEGQNNLLLAHAYYVRPNTINDDGVPSLRRRQLGTGPALTDQEIIPGVEDLQVQFGIDSDGNGTVDRYVNPDNAALNAGPVVRAVRVWLRMRSESPEIGFTDTRTYTYADREYTPAADEADFRRLLVSRTIFLRNEAIPEASL
ncbi:MAG: PilW family protein, partial [Gammaproteobacteria bacterium]|nr:PilW family protein [Gammaproteobacteria bacterium]